MKLKFAVAAVLAASSMTAFAADQTIVLDADGTQVFSSRDVVGTVLEGGNDVLTFQGGTVGGLYDVFINVSGQYLEWDATKTTLNGVAGEWIGGAQGKVVRWLGVETTATSPFVLNLAGTSTDKGFYTGNISITSAVPEPSTYGMLIGGLGILGFLARRKSKQA